nr:MAG TPA: hypothetical protein [Caudoviricetes sp.]
MFLYLPYLIYLVNNVTIITKKADTSKDTSLLLTLINYSSFYLLHLLSTPSPYSKFHRVLLLASS